MTYKLTGKKWMGFCDGCEFPFEPAVLNYCIYLAENKKKNHFKDKLTGKKIVGYCDGCCKKEATAGYHIIKNINIAPKLVVRNVCGVKVV
jgi:hypothetical protein